MRKTSGSDHPASPALKHGEYGFIRAERTRRASPGRAPKECNDFGRGVRGSPKQLVALGVHGKGVWGQSGLRRNDIRLRRVIYFCILASGEAYKSVIYDLAVV